MSGKVAGEILGSLANQVPEVKNIKMLSLKRIIKSVTRIGLTGIVMAILGTTITQAIQVQMSWSEPFLRTVGQDLDQFWGYVFRQADLAAAFSPPNVQWHTLDDEQWGIFQGSNPAAISTGCGQVSVNPALYCPRDHTIYLDVDRMDKLIYEVAVGSNMDGDAVAVFIIAHEYAHAVQMMLESPLQNPRRELQADCLAGLYLHHSEILQAAEDDLDELAVGVLKAGDYEQYSAQHHGIGMRRLAAMMTGLQGNVQACVKAEF